MEIGLEDEIIEKDDKSIGRGNVIENYACGIIKVYIMDLKMN